MSLHITITITLQCNGTITVMMNYTAPPGLAALITLHCHYNYIITHYRAHYTLGARWSMMECSPPMKTMV